MGWSSTLLVETGAGRQWVRSPLRTDPIGAALRDGYPVAHRLPDDMRRLLGRLENVAETGRVTGRG